MILSSSAEVTQKSSYCTSGHWLKRAPLKDIRNRVGLPFFIYSEQRLRENIARVRSGIDVSGLGDRVKLYVPFFPNANPHFLAPLRDMGVGILVQMPNEYELLTRHGFSDFIVSPGHISNQEIDFWSTKSHPIFLGSIEEAAHALSRGSSSVSVRIDSLNSDKAGIKKPDLPKLVSLLERHNAHLECFEVYCGSGNTLASMIAIVREIFDIFRTYFPTARSIDFAGGHGFSYDAWDVEEKHFDWTTYFKAIAEIAHELQIPEYVDFLFEPARDLLADTGALILGVRREVISHVVGNIVVTDGSRMLMPSAQLRERSHHVVFLDQLMQEIQPQRYGGKRAKLRGCSILRNDYVLPGEIAFPDGLSDRDALAILDTGAYCATQHMEFLNVPPCPEVIIDASGAARLATRRGDPLDKWRNLAAMPEDLIGG